MKLRPRLALEIALLLAFPFYWIASEIYYARSKRPLGVSTLSDFYQRFGQPARVHELHRDGVKYYELSGHLHSRGFLRSHHPGQHTFSMSLVASWSGAPTQATTPSILSAGRNPSEVHSTRRHFHHGSRDDPPSLLLPRGTIALKPGAPSAQFARSFRHFHQQKPTSPSTHAIRRYRRSS